MRLSALALLALASGCAWFGTEKPERRILVPDELLKRSDYTPEGQYPRSRYVLRMTDGERDWEVEFPEVATGYEIRIPLQGEPNVLAAKPQGSPLTAADREILADMARQNPDLAAPPDPAEPAVVAAAGPDDAATQPPETTDESGTQPAAPPRTSYLAGLAEVRELYRTRNYEVALVKLVELERQYPRDERLLAMKGSLYRQLGRAELARQAWEDVLKLNPDNQAVIDALQRLARP